MAEVLDTFAFFNEDFPWFFTALAFIFGAIVGSFLNVCIYRIPAEKSVVFPGSTCACGEPIPFYHNIPILSWLILRGKASCCDQTFSIRYPTIELLTGVLFLASWMTHPPLIAILGMWFIAFLVCATFIDLDHMIIPDRFSIGGMVIGVVLSFAFPQLHGAEGGWFLAGVQSAVESIIGALVGAGLVYWIATLGEVVFRKPAMGEGDVKFVGFIGAVCGWQGAVFSMFGGAMIGSVFLLPFVLYARLFGSDDETEQITESGDLDEENPDTEEEDDAYDAPFGTQVPFGPMLAVAGLIYFLGFDSFVDAYFADFSAVFFGSNR